jgi:hypothetical protein
MSKCTRSLLHTQDENAGIAPCYKSMRTNVSREMMELSDYEFNAPTLFPRHEIVYDYLNSYARHFGIIGGDENIVRFERTVTSVCTRIFTAGSSQRRFCGRIIQSSELRKSHSRSSAAELTGSTCQ